MNFYTRRYDAKDRAASELGIICHRNNYFVVVNLLYVVDMEHYEAFSSIVLTPQLLHESETYIALVKELLLIF